VPVLVPGLTISQSADTAAGVPGQKVTFTVTIADSGQTAYTGATVAISLAGIPDDAVYDSDAAATTGTVS
jgi:hypothetical protein